MPRVARTLVLAVAVAAGCTEGPVAPATEPVNVQLHLSNGGAKRLTVSDGNASGFRENRSEYHWTINKRVSRILAGEHMLPEGSTSETRLDLIQPDRAQTKWIEYELVADRTGPTERAVTGLRGRVCLTNAPDNSKLAIKIVTTVQRATRSGYADVTTPRVVDVSAKPALAGGESYCYPFEISFDGTSDVQYRSNTVVTALGNDALDDEDDGAKGERTGTALASDIRYVWIPRTSTQVISNATAHVWDGHGAQGNQMWATGGCAEVWPLFQCTSDTDWGDWDFTSTTTVHYMVDMHNLFACGANYVFRNKAVLTESGTGYPGAERERRESSAFLKISTPDCPP